MRGDWKDEARRFEDIDKAILKKLSQCGQSLPCGIRDGRWPEHVCYLPPGHEDIDSGCRCTLCSGDGPK